MNELTRPRRKIFDKEAVKSAAQGRIADVLRDLCGVPARAIDFAKVGVSRETPCPKCGGKTRFRVTDLNVGRVFCSHCCRDKSEGSSDVFGAVGWFKNCSFSEAVEAVADYLGVAPTAGTPTSSFASAKREKSANEASSETLNSTQTPRLAQAAPVVQTDYRYRDELGVERWRGVRIETFDADGKRVSKTFRLGRVVGGKFEKGLDGEKVPPYNLPELLDPACRFVYVVEGEKCADALNAFFNDCAPPEDRPKHVATTLPNGAQTAKRWEEYADLFDDKSVCVFADNDEPGEAAARTVAQIASRRAAEAKIVVFGRVERNGSTVEFKRPGTNEAAPEKYDVADFFADLYASTDDRGERAAAFGRLQREFSVKPSGIAPRTPELPADRREGSPESARKPLPETAPEPDGKEEENADAALDPETRKTLLETLPDFPLDALPWPVADYCGEVAEIYGAPLGAAVACALVCLGAAVGRRAELREKRTGHDERLPPLLSAVVVAKSGGGKSPLMKAFGGPIRRRQVERNREFNKRLEEVKNPEKDRVFCRALCVDDMTPESAKENCVRNQLAGELSACLGYFEEATRHFQMGAYKKSGSLSDISTFNKLLDGDASTSTRRTSNALAATGPVSFAILGGVQPSAMLDVLKADGALFSTGYVYRFLWVNMPYRRGKNGATPRLRAPYEALFDRFEAWRQNLVFKLDDAALDRWNEYVDATEEKVALYDRTGNDPLFAYFNKSKKVVLQVALLLRCVDWAARAKEDEDFVEYDAERRTPVVDGETLSRAVEITRWFCESFENVLNVFADVERKPQTLATGEIWLERRIVEVVAKYAGGKGYAKNSEITPHIKALHATKKKERTKIYNRLVKNGKLEAVADDKGRLLGYRAPSTPAAKSEETDDEANE